MRESDANYCKRRAIDEQVAAQTATSEAARRCHDKLAVMYRFRATILSEAESWAFSRKPLAEVA